MPSVIRCAAWPDSWFSFSRVLPLLSDTFRTVALDQRWFGDSDRPDSSDAIPEMAKDRIAFLDALRIERATLPARDGVEGPEPEARRLPTAGVP